MKIEFEGPALNEEGHKSFLEQVYYASAHINDVAVRQNSYTIGLDPAFSGEPEGLKSSLIELAERVAKSAPRKPFKVVEEHHGQLLNHEDPFPDLQQRGVVRQTSTGVFVIQGEFLNRMRALDGWLRRMALDEEAVEQFLPVTVPAQSLADCGYLYSFPQHAYFCTPVLRDYERLKSLSKGVRNGAVPASNFDNAQTVLSPTVCYHCFESLRGSNLEENLTITAVNQCHRHELKNATGLSRLQTYTMREYVFYGENDYVIAQRKAYLDKTLNVLRKWDFKFRVVVASDPFFASGAEAKKAFQLLSASKLELQAYLPHTDKWLAIASFNNHQQTLSNPFGISMGGHAAHSGCIGYGYERFLYSIYAQRGSDPHNWPEALLATFANEVPAL